MDPLLFVKPHESYPGFYPRFLISKYGFVLFSEGFDQDLNSLLAWQKRHFLSRISENTFLSKSPIQRVTQIRRTTDLLNDKYLVFMLLSL